MLRKINQLLLLGFLMTTIIPLTETKLPDNCYVFKHSTACPISASAAEHVRGLTFDLPVYWLNVIEQRDLSNWVEREYGVQHESPQLLRIEDGRVIQDWSHRAINSIQIPTN